MIADSLAVNPRLLQPIAWHFDCGERGVNRGYNTLVGNAQKNTGAGGESAGGETDAPGGTTPVPAI